ncbi:2-keto-4-pentenoate hydratase [Paenibacillus sp. GSMTC-2017]|uniref:2-keto-4-pentenoate hydratase n=1 Tax=Paenibacillus sp. GSMTC-2017 TaxID=2794350 RepID=UPI0018D6C928|nr:2-keto-4-pentenoate hydratase [Paenibacillus sp. GSMTC-2017]MBH5318317.1 2-keto-4-pentenoate hydratase [Paenibacillus sp. GSMTC-2017]
MKPNIETLANELMEAETTKVAIAPFTERYSEMTVTDAYNVQLQVVKVKKAAGKTIIGKKVGLTSKAMQTMLNVNEPDYGHLLDDMEVADGGVVKVSEMVAPRIEAEIGFILDRDLSGPDVTFLDVLMATKYIVPTLEIIDSRIADWKIKLIDTVADNGSSAKVVVSGQKTPIDNIDLRDLSMILSKNGEQLATGAGAAALGHPAYAIAWLANKLSEFGISLKAGEIILPGALSGAVAVQAGDHIEARFGSIGSVSVSFQ